MARLTGFSPRRRSVAEQRRAPRIFSQGRESGAESAGRIRNDAVCAAPPFDLDQHALRFADPGVI
jgi:hypothetical protein